MIIQTKHNVNNIADSTDKHNVSPLITKWIRANIECRDDKEGQITSKCCLYTKYYSNIKLTAEQDQKLQHTNNISV